MEKKLRKLFEYQKFAQNKHLDEIIKNTLPNEVVELDDDAIFAVAGGKQDEQKRIEKPIDEPTSPTHD